MAKTEAEWLTAAQSGLKEAANRVTLLKSMNFFNQEQDGHNELAAVVSQLMQEAYAEGVIDGGT